MQQEVRWNTNYTRTPSVRGYGARARPWNSDEYRKGSGLTVAG